METGEEKNNHQIKSQLDHLIKLDQEETVKLLTQIIEHAKLLDYRILDELNSIESVQSENLQLFLTSLEKMAIFWGLIKKEKY